MKNHFIIPFALVIIFFLALSFRFIFFPKNIYFGFDQARDAFISTDWIQNHRLKLLGPPTDLLGVFHGPLYYYLIGPFYTLSQGDPTLPFAGLMVLNASGVFLIYWLAKILFNSKVGLLSALLFAFSFEQYQYSFYAADPSPGVISTLVFYIGSALFFLRRKNWGLLLAAVGLGTAIHFEFFLCYLIIVFLIFLVAFKKSISINSWWAAISGFVFLSLMGNYLLAELKYSFRMTRSLTGFFNLTVSELPKFTDHLVLIAEKYAQHIYLNFFGFSLFFSGLIFFWLIYFFSKKGHQIPETQFILVWILGPVILYFTNIATLGYFMTNIGVSAGLTILFSYLFLEIIKPKTLTLILLIALIIIGNLKLLASQGQNGLVWGLLAVQTGMLLKDEKDIVDFTYQESNKTPFTIKTLTMPLKIQTTWAYLYNQYGKKKYGYLPVYPSGNIPGFPGKFPQTNQNICSLYLIMEPMRGVPDYFVNDFLQTAENESKLITSKKFGSLTVQKRLLYACKENKI